jgi:hypothetical protein
LQQVQAAIQPHLTRPTSLGMTEPPLKSIPKGKTIYYVYHAVPVESIEIASARRLPRRLAGH